MSSDHIPRLPLSDPTQPVPPDEGPWSTRGYAHEEDQEPTPVKVLIYSDDRSIRQQVLASLGPRPHPDLPPVEYTECATEPMVIAQVGSQRFDLLVLDGEAVPAGGMGIARQLKDEIFDCPPILVLIGRPQDAWLATWSRADSVVPHPLEPIALARAVTTLLRRRVAVSG